MDMVEEAMKAAGVDYKLKEQKTGHITGKDPAIQNIPRESEGSETGRISSADKNRANGPSQIDNELSAKAVTDITIKQERLNKLAPYTSDRFIKEDKENVKDLISDLKKIAESIEMSGKSKDPMAIAIHLKRLEKVMKAGAAIIIPYANNQYVTGNYSTTDAKIAKYTPRRKWSYSAGLRQEQALLDARKKIEQESGVAVDDSPPIDVTKSKLFTISLK